MPRAERYASLLQQLARHASPDDALPWAKLRWLSQAANPALPGHHARLSRMVHEHVKLHKPLAYLIGHQPFGPLDIAIRPPILIPRPETEYWVSELAHRLRLGQRDGPLRILDIGSGSGCISLLLAALLPAESSHLTGVDVDPHAVALAQENAQTLAAQLANPIRFHRADVFSDSLVQHYEHAFDLVVSNPPYVTPAEVSQLARSVADWETPLALIGQEHKQDAQGLAYYHRLAAIAPALLRKPRQASTIPSVVVEIGAQQGPQVQHLFQRATGAAATVRKDQYARDRTVELHWPAPA